MTFNTKLNVFHVGASEAISQCSGHFKKQGTEIIRIQEIL